MRTTLSLTTLLTLLILFATSVSAQNTGKVRGTLVDAANGEGLIGANIIIEGMSLGAAADIYGNFTIEPVPPGTYTIHASMIGYAKKTVTGVVVKAGETTKLEMTLAPEAFEMQEVVVEAKLLTNNEAGLLKDRQKAASISDAISAEDISRSGSGDAAAAMNKVTGASTVDGKYIYIRGLGERYTSTQLNGAEVPSADPNRRAVQLDLFPASFLENLVTTKTFTPDKPGNYTGGSVNISTKSFPDKLTLSLSSSTSWNSQTTGSGSFLTYAGGATDWLGFDDGTRAIPDALQDPNVEIPDLSFAFTDEEKAMQLDSYSKSFNSTMAPTRTTAPVNQSYALSFGNQYDVLGQAFGFLGSLTYSRQYSQYTNGEVGRYQLTGHVDDVDELTNDYMFTDQKGNDEVLWGGLLNMSYKLGQAHEMGFNVIYNRSADNTARYLSGSFPRDLTGNATYETRNLHYVERELQTYQLRGKHHFDALGGLNVEWIGSMSSNAQDEPDVRYFTDNYTIRERNGVTDTIYTIRPSIYPIPSRYYRNLVEDNNSFNIDMDMPFQQWNGLAAKVKFGGAYLNKERTFTERRFDFGQDAIRYDGDAADFFNPANVGILPDQSTEQFFRFGNYVIDATSLSNNYGGTQDIYAGYMMIDLPIFNDFRLIGGARYETTKMDVASMDTSLTRGQLDNQDLLPSVNLLYNVSERMNLRAAYGKTLARPTFRELAPYASFNFVNDFTFIGNADLERTLIDNYDLRWEWFVRPGEILAVSGFYKSFSNPIERVIKNVNGEIEYQNVSEARVYGIEFEFRKRLDEIADFLNYFYIGTNFTWTKSVVDISQDELDVIRAVNPYADGTRELQGQSPYLFNVNLAYQNYDQGTSVSLFYNVFGERLSAVALGGTPNVYEQPRAMLDFIASQRLFWGFTAKFSAKNLLDEAVRHVHHFEGTDYVYSSFNTGRNFSFGISYTFE
ncbi:TonB-dependent receptor [bacterium]|nr:TonB-dependent receptor [bacterium]